MGAALCCAVLQVAESPVAPGVHLPMLAQSSAKLTAQNFGLAIAERLALPLSDHLTPFSYLIKCFGLVDSSSSSNLMARSRPSTADAVCRLLKHQIVAHSGRVLLAENALCSEEARQRSLLDLRKLLESDASLSRALPADFFEQFCTQHETHMTQFFSGVLSDIAEHKHESSMGCPGCNRALRSLVMLSSQPQSARIVYSHPKFMPFARTGREFEAQCLLGPFLSAGPIFSDPVFSNPERQDLKAYMRQLRNQASDLQRLCQKVFQNLARVGEDACDHVVKWFATIIRLNSSRAQMNYDP